MIDPAQGPGDEFWPGHRVLTESPVTRVNPIFYINQNDVVLVKKKK
jgi:hypothetical protein